MRDVSNPEVLLDGLAARPRIVQNSVDGTLLLLVSEGCCLVGAGRSAVRLPAYYLGLHPVTNAQYCQFLDATMHEAPALSQAWTGELRAPDRLNHPVGGVSWDDAMAYCRWAGLRLPSELEWEKGARGVDGREFPWGNDWQHGRCRSNGNRNQRYTAAVWDYVRGCSPWGQYQMSGNVWEWCTDWYDRGAPLRWKSGDTAQAASGTGRVLRGGSWLVDDPDEFRCASRCGNLPDYRGVDCGFRCAITA